MATASTAATNVTQVLAVTTSVDGGGVVTANVGISRNVVLKTYSAAFTVTTTPYSALDVVGAKKTLSSMAMRNGASFGVLKANLVVPQNLGTMSLVLHLFNTDPSASTITDNSALAITVANVRDCWAASIPLIPVQHGSSMWTYQSGQISENCFPGGSTTDIYCCLETKAAVTFAAGDLELQFVVEQDRG